MTMNLGPTMIPDVYRREARRAQTEYAALAAKWGVEAVGRAYPVQVIRADGYRFVRPGKWYVVRQGKCIPATASQARALNRVGSHGVGSIGPIAAVAAA